MTKFEYRCDICNCGDKCVSHEPVSCGKNMATITCGMSGCDRLVRYPIGVDHPRYCREHEHAMMKRLRVRHKKLDSFGVASDAAT